MDLSFAYAENCSISKRDNGDYMKKYEHLLRWKKYKENVLDVGCADGSVTREVLFPFLEGRVRRLEAIDKLEFMIELAQSVNDKKEIHFKTMDINNEEYIASREGEFDHIFSFYCMQWIGDTRSLLNGFYKMLKPGGQIFVSIVNNTPLHRSFEKQSKERTWSKYLSNTQCFANYGENPKRYIQDVLETIGFDIDLCKSKYKTGVTENFKDFTRSLIYMYDLLDHIPEELREEYIMDHLRNNCEGCVYLGDPDKYELRYESIIVIASKKM